MQKSKILIFNSLTRKKEELKLVDSHKKQVKIYSCGVTVYDDCHIGHAMQAIFFDVIRRFLKSKGYNTQYIRNYTDVDDKIINRAIKLGIAPKQLADKMIVSCQEDMAAIGVLPADIEPRVSDYIPEIIAMIETLIQNKAAYVTDSGDVYYEVKQKNDYGKLSNRKPDELLSGTRELVGGEKKDSLDFALWKRDSSEGASWESPWGLGRPGWHIECSVMAKHCLSSDTIDIHGGGRDLIFPHHENEIAQSESANCAKFANYWMHSGLLTVNKQKMSKSIGNTIRIKDFLEEFHPEVLRLSYLQNHYSSNVDFSRRVFLDTRKRLFYFYETMFTINETTQGLTKEKEISKKEKAYIQAFEDSFDQAMYDDFNTPKALAELAKFTKWSNQKVVDPKVSRFTLEKVSQVMRQVCEPFGLFQENPKNFLDSQKEKVLKDLGITEDYIEAQIKSRQTARDQKDWNKADSIRKDLLISGISLMDTQQACRWRIAL